jgi:hypothetical protein
MCFAPIIGDDLLECGNDFADMYERGEDYELARDIEDDSECNIQPASYACSQ